MTCKCENLEKTSAPYSVQVGRYKINWVNIPHLRCNQCGALQIEAAMAEQCELWSSSRVLRQYDTGPSEIRFARKACGLNQNQLAKKFGLTQESISRYETGDLAITAEYRYALLGLLAEEEAEPK